MSRMTRNQKNESDSVGVHALYSYYPSKKVTEECKYTRPYVPLKEREDKEISLTKKQFLEIIDVYLSHLFSYLMKGNLYTMWRNMGTIQMIKYKPKQSTAHIDWGHYRKTGERKLHTNEHSDGFKFVLNWTKTRTNPKLRWWLMRLTRSRSALLGKELLAGEPVLMYLNER